MREFVCDVCGKAYGSDGSLSQHVKLKHPEQAKDLLRLRPKQSSQSSGQATEEEASCGTKQ